MSKTHEHEHHRWDDDGGHLGHPDRLRHLKKRWVKAAERFCAAYTSQDQRQPCPELTTLLLRWREWRDAH